jgi:hypothetical protein
MKDPFHLSAMLPVQYEEAKVPQTLECPKDIYDTDLKYWFLLASGSCFDP